MRYLAVLWFALLALCCTPPVAQAPAPSQSLTTVHMFREFAITVHVDTGFRPEGRALLLEAARKWRDVSDGHVQITLVFDLDFDDVAGIEAHYRAKHATLVGLVEGGSLVEKIDALLGGPGVTPLAATSQPPDMGPAVFLILDRIERSHFLPVVMHEFGHLVGFPDQRTVGDIMSGAEIHGAPVPQDFTARDVQMCRAALLCN